VRVLSDGEVTPSSGGTSSTGPAGGDQTITDTIGGIQVGAPGTFVPVTVGSDPDDPVTPTDPGDGATTPPAPAPGGGTTPGGSGTEDGSGGGGGSGGGDRPGSRIPAVDIAPDDGSGVDPLAALRTIAAQTSELSGGLPFTGLSALGLALIGLLLFHGGRGLLIVGSKRGPRIPRSA
jgi:hypothetical protein